MCIESVCWVFILVWCVNKPKRTLLQELQSKCDTSWMGHWTGKILKFLWQEIPRIAVEYISSKSSSQYTGLFHFGIVLSFQIIHLIGYNTKPIVRPIYQSIPFWNTLSVSLVWSVCCDSLPIVAQKISWLKMGNDDQISIYCIFLKIF